MEHFLVEITPSTACATWAWMRFLLLRIVWLKTFVWMLLRKESLHETNCFGYIWFKIIKTFVLCVGNYGEDHLHLFVHYFLMGTLLYWVVILWDVPFTCPFSVLVYLSIGLIWICCPNGFKFGKWFFFSSWSRLFEMLETMWYFNGILLINQTCFGTFQFHLAWLLKGVWDNATPTMKEICRFLNQLRSWVKIWQSGRYSSAVNRST